ncbi:serine hydrolase domain-containing protein [Amycolatopsis anabasis]|uniref:serine hydrolase domain-containing protein n=1 Tax=Amycolatopsis anabasis TaxID=1840409 RepID=UPI001FE872E1|nr:serine hydrolase [Amycolatopsis anabasis]
MAEGAFVASGNGARLDQKQLLAVIDRDTREWNESARDMVSYLASQVADASDRGVLGPLLAATGGSGVVRFGGCEVARWGDTSAPEMAFSATKSVISVVAGIAYDTGLLIPRQRVYDVLGLSEFATGDAREITWEHLLQQTSQWEGTLWTKPTSVDVQSFREGTEVHGTPPGQGWAYNDVRVNVLTYALTVLFGRSLEEVLREEVMTPIGASRSWSWHGYDNSFVEINGASIPVVSGGAHWGGGLFISAADLALIGQLYLDGGRWGQRQVISTEWITRSWSPCEVKPEYGYLWWLNDDRIPWPTAPTTGRCARGNGGRHLLWVDPARDLVLSTHWTEHIDQLLAQVSAAITPASD